MTKGLGIVLVGLALLTSCATDGGNDSLSDRSVASPHESSGTEPGPSGSSLSANSEDEPAEVSELDGVSRIAVLPNGQARRPLLAWEHVEGADRYSVVVLAPDGAPYWAWQGRTTSVPFGGEPQLHDTAPGPAVTPGMTWTVAALDADGHAIALSDTIAFEG